MCLIIHKPANVTIDTDKWFPEIYGYNQDGFGLMYFEKGKIKCHKILPKDLKEINALYEKHKTQELGIHFRLKTHGNRDLDRVHPFQVLNVKDHGEDLYMMHNGILSGYTGMAKDGESDTTALIKEKLTPWFANYGAKMLDDPFMIELLEEHIGKSNKLLFLTQEGKFIKVNEAAGTDKKIDDCWISNTYAFRTTNNTSYGGSNYSAWSSYWRGGEKNQDELPWKGRTSYQSETSAWYDPKEISMTYPREIFWDENHTYVGASNEVKKSIEVERKALLEAKKKEGKEPKKEEAKQVKEEPKKANEKKEVKEIAGQIDKFPLFFEERPDLTKESKFNKFLLDSIATEVSEGQIIDGFNFDDFDPFSYNSIQELVFRYPQEAANLIYMLSILRENGVLILDYDSVNEHGYMEELMAAVEESEEQEEEEKQLDNMVERWKNIAGGHG